jgi:gamma-glutamylcyclotransferase
VTRLGGSVPYFAYGANIHPGWIGRRVPTLTRLGAGLLAGHRLDFHKRGRDGSGKSNAWRTGDAADRLPGALYRLPVQYLEQLGAAASGYHVEEVLVDSAAGPLTALMWRANEEEIEDGLRPWGWYVALIRAGAAMHDLPESHIRWLGTVPVIQDPDQTRAGIALAILSESAASKASRTSP